eukprot:snap_masked-scaffold_58-processed-gene-0.36-mRNA-1 protein AED:1.00 eAED:1.00 QI:0/0/0/0/1/1/2/0/331
MSRKKSSDSTSSDDTLTLRITKQLSAQQINDTNDFFDIEQQEVIPATVIGVLDEKENEIKLRRAVTVADQKLKGKAEDYLSKESCASKYLNKGSISNLLSFIVMIIGIILFSIDENSEAAKYILSLGGFTNFLAIKMLFDKVPFLVGSGVILREFKSIRKAIKQVIMEMFFDKEFLEEYLSVRAQELVRKVDIKGMIEVALSDPQVEKLLIQKLRANAKGNKIGNKFIKGLLKVQKAENVVKIFKPILGKMAGEIVPAIIENVEFNQLFDLDLVEKEVDKLLTEKLDLLTPELVKRLLERLIREHLGWLVVWGNVFGGLIGVISQAVGFGP